MPEHSENSVPPGPSAHLGATAAAPPLDAHSSEVSTPGHAAQNGHLGPASRIETLEAELADWQRRAVIWRERALSTQALNDALTNNLEDLRAMLELRVALDDVAPRDRTVARTPATNAPAEQWWTKVFRRDTWVTGR